MPCGSLLWRKIENYRSENYKGSARGHRGQISQKTKGEGMRANLRPGGWGGQARSEGCYEKRTAEARRFPVRLQPEIRLEGLRRRRRGAPHAGFDAVASGALGQVEGFVGGAQQL